MKLSSVVRVIQAHRSGSEQEFAGAVSALAEEEERKGNRSGAKAIRDAYPLAGPIPSNVAQAGPLVASSAEVFEASSMPAAVLPGKMPPKDRDSALELYEWVRPQVRLDSLVLPERYRRSVVGFIEEQKQMKRLSEMGLGASQRLLLCGPPGCGKTQTALAVATELGLPVAYVRLDGLVSSFLGQTGTNMRRVFDSLRDQRVVLFLDEIDAIAKKRDDQHELGELKRVVTTLLQNFDNLSNSVVLIAATNHPHLLDPALWRRFNVVISFSLPDEDMRRDLLERFLSRFPVEGIKIPSMVKATEGLSPANLEEVVTQAAKLALIRRNQAAVRQEDLFSSLVQFIAASIMAGDDRPQDVLLAVASHLHAKGLTIRDIEKGTGIPKSTLQERLTRMKGGLTHG